MGPVQRLSSYSDCKLTIVVPTFNSIKTLPALDSSLRRQVSKLFTVIYVDGGSTDDTVTWLKKPKEYSCSYLLGPDDGIYDAINKALRILTTTHYLVVGSDDTLLPHAVAEYNKAILSAPLSLITAPIYASGSLRIPTSRANLLKGPFSLISSHSVGCVIPVYLHTIFGFYQHSLSIAADFLFLQSCLDAGINVTLSPCTAGFYASEGLSSRHPYKTIMDQYYALCIARRATRLTYIWVPIARLTYLILKKAAIRFLDVFN